MLKKTQFVQKKYK